MYLISGNNIFSLLFFMLFYCEFVRVGNKLIDFVINISKFFSYLLMEFIILSKLLDTIQLVRTYRRGREG
jgi:hypothetical protein